MNAMNLIHGDCLEELKNIPDKSVDFVYTDLPYNQTACKKMGRKFIGMEMDDDIYKLAQKRISEAVVSQTDTSLTESSS